MILYSVSSKFSLNDGTIGEHEEKIISVSVLAISIIMAVTIVTIALYNWISKGIIVMKGITPL